MSKQPGYSWISPYLLVNDVEAAMKFYEKAFGFDKKQAMPGPDGNIVHAELTYQGQTVMIGKTGVLEDNIQPPVSSGVKSPMSLYVYCENVDKFYATATAAGAKSLQAPNETYWGDRMCSLQDLDGYLWNFATHTGEMDIAKAQI